MLATLAVVLPIFAVILAGFVGRRAGIFGATATTELNRFVVWLGLPALLFSITATATWEQLYQPGFVGAFGLSCVIVFAGTVLLRMRRQSLADASVDGLVAAYPNAGYIGFPLCLAALGPASFPLVTITAIITACVMFAVAIVLIEISVQSDRALGPLLAKVGLSLAKNPLIVAPVAGAFYAAAGLPLPHSLDSFLKLLGAAASPSALVALGTFLADRRPGTARDLRGELMLSIAKLFVQPALTYGLAYYVFDLPKATADTAVLIAAISTGTGPFMLAEFYGCDATVTANVILFTTLASLVTISLFLYLSGYGHLAS
jgi:predicted permease